MQTNQEEEIILGIGEIESIIHGMTDDRKMDGESTEMLKFGEKSQVEVSLPLEPISEVMVVIDQEDDEEEVTFNNLRSDILPINEVMTVIDEDDEDVSFNNIRSDIPILIKRKQKRLESESDPLALVRFFFISTKEKTVFQSSYTLVGIAPIGIFAANLANNVICFD